MEGRFSFILYTGANSTCRLDTHLACKFILFILTGSLYFFIAFHVSASVAGEVVKAAVVLNMVIGAMRNLTMLNFNFHTIQMYQRICIVLKVVEPMTTLIAAILLLTGFGISVTCNFMTIRMLGVIPMPFYLYFPFAVGISNHWDWNSTPIQHRLSCGEQ